MLFTIFLVFFIFCFGLVMGSFLNVLVLRMYHGESLRGRSRCPSCKKTLTARELMPLLSFIAQKARCTGCREKISWQYPLVELFAGFSYLLALWTVLSYALPRTPLDQWFLILVFFIGIPAALIIVLTDIRWKMIPDWAVVMLGIVGVSATLLRSFQPSGTFTPQILWYDAGIAAIMTAFLGSLWFFSRGRWMGFGDVKLIFATSLIAGYPSAIAALLFAFWTGGIMGTVALVAQKKGLKHQIPFGPFILLGALLAYFFSDGFLRQSGLSDIVQLM